MTTRKNAQENKQQLLAAGLSILIQQGYNHTGIKQIVDHVGIPKGSFYNYFDSKESFGTEVIQYYAGQILTELNRVAASQDADALESLKGFFRATIAMYEEKQFREGCLVGNLAAELADTNDLIRLELAGVFAEWQVPTTKLLTQAQEDGTVRKDIPADVLAQFLWNSFEGALLRMKIEKSIVPLEQWFTFMLEDFVEVK